MINFLKKLFGKKESSQEQASPEFSQEEYEKDYELKAKGLESVLGKMHDLVGHAIIPFDVGGAIDMYYFPHHLPGTGFATMELLRPDGTGPKPNRLGTYELVAFTKHPYYSGEENNNPFNLAERRVCGLFTIIGSYSFDVALNPLETCEVPDNEGKENKCLVFDHYRDFFIGDRPHHLLLCLEVFRSEMEYARANGSGKLLERLKQTGHYPYSDLDRLPVV